jgi:hypothetical protein
VVGPDDQDPPDTRSVKARHEGDFIGRLPASSDSGTAGILPAL